MREILLWIGRREKEEEERKKREIDEAKRKEEEERREGEKLREEQAREAKLEATIVRILMQHEASMMKTPASQAGNGIKKRSPHSKARMLRDITSYIAESEDDSEEVKEEAEKLIEALESRRKPKQGAAIIRTAVSRVKKVPTPRRDKAREDNRVSNGEVFETPRKACPAECSSEGLVDFALSQTKVLSAVRAGDIQKICDKEGIAYVKKDISIQEIVRCRTRLAYEGFFELKSQTPDSKTPARGLETP
ncbi:hypothetical protein CBR_g8039 [Chara braunii]|uniref:Uncharacterized protein n=1 Tax=Chara braunii TaxID=69332 RepID=A0A388KL20_CHABU|nr:hypothetical protein CBR_g8039 [Chara braunii]|eukprot:GBG70742.1 hypothetical protein CBR_g8039 [Chara braunii]